MRRLRFSPADDASARVVRVIDWQFYPKSDPLPHHSRALLSVFEAAEPVIQSRPNDDSRSLSSNQVLSILAGPLIDLGYLVEAGKRAEDRISVPVLFGRNGLVE